MMKKKNVIISLFLLVLFGVFVSSVSAEIIIDSGKFIDNNGWKQDLKNYTDFGGADSDTFSGIYFRKIEEYPFFTGLKINADETNKYYFQRLNTTSNYTSTDAYLTDSSNRVVSTGIFGYHWSDANGEWYIYYIADSWFIYDNTGETHLKLHYDLSVFDLKRTEYTLSGTYLTNDRDIGFVGGPYISPWSSWPIVTGWETWNYYYTVEYEDKFENDWQFSKEEEDSSYYEVNIVKEFSTSSYNSRIKLMANNGGVNSTIFDQTSNTDEEITGLYKMADLFYLEVWAKNNTFYDYALLYPEEEGVDENYPDLSLTIDKGDESGNPLEIDETTYMRLSGVNEATNVIVLKWSENLDDINNQESYSIRYSKNVSTNKWNRNYYGFADYLVLDYSYTGYTLTEITRQLVKFNWSMDNSEWDFGTSPFNYVEATVYGNYGASNPNYANIELPVYVVRDFETGLFQLWALDENFNTKIYDYNLWVYDFTNSNWIYNGANITSAYVNIETIIGGKYSIKVGRSQYTFTRAYDFLNDRYINLQSGYVNITSESNIEQQIGLLMQKGYAANTSIIFKTVNEENIPISNVEIEITSDSTYDKIYTDDSGTVYFAAIDNLEYNWNAFRLEYGRYFGTFTAYTDQVITITMIQILPTTTATVTPTPTPTETPDGEEGDLVCTDLLSCIRAYLDYLGFSADNGNLFLAMIVILICSVIIGYITRSGMGALVGAAIGFIISLATSLIPTWVLVAMIVIFGLILAGKWISGGGE